MATDTAPRPARRMYWQLPVFALGVTAAVLAWRYFPQTGLADTRGVEQDRFSLRQSVARRPADLAEVQSLLAKLGDAGTPRRWRFRSGLRAGVGVPAVG